MHERIAFTLSLLLASTTGCAGTEVEVERASAPSSTAPRRADDFVMNGSYAIMIYRKLEAGDRFNLYSASKSVQDNLVEVRGQLAKQERIVKQSEIEATGTVLAATDKGPSKLRYRIERFTIDGEPALAQGQILVFTPRASPPVALEGGAPPPESALKEIVERLALMLTAEDEEMLAGPTSRRPGETWPIVPAAFAKGVNGKSGLFVRPEDVSGNATFVRIEPMAGHDCTLITSDIHVASFKWTEESENAHLLSGRMRVDYDILVPADPARRDLYSSRAEVAMDFTMKVIATDVLVEPLVKSHLQLTQVMTLQPIDAAAE